jgi:hypothetical protein
LFGKGDSKNAKKYRGITVTPTLSKIIEKILKIRENGKILLNQNPLQKGFTENSSPLLCELLVEEFEPSRKFRRGLIYSLYRSALETSFVELPVQY